MLHEYLGFASEVPRRLCSSLGQSLFLPGQREGLSKCSIRPRPGWQCARRVERDIRDCVCLRKSIFEFVSPRSRTLRRTGLFFEKTLPRGSKREASDLTHARLRNQSPGLHEFALPPEFAPGSLR